MVFQVFPITCMFTVWYYTMLMEKQISFCSKRNVFQCTIYIMSIEIVVRPKNNDFAGIIAENVRV